MTEKDRKMNELMNRLVDALATSNPYGPFIERAEKVAEEIYALGYDEGYRDGYDVACRDELDAQKFSFR